MSPRHVRVLRVAIATTSSSSKRDESTASFEHETIVIFEDESRVWNDIELFQM